MSHLETLIMNLFELNFFVSVLDYSSFLYFFLQYRYARNLAGKNMSNVKKKKIKMIVSTSDRSLRPMHMRLKH